jgi:hypothetical protein
MLSEHQLINIFCQMDDFYKEFQQLATAKMLSFSKTRKRGPKCSLSTSEVMTLLVAFQSSRFRDLKAFFYWVSCHWKKYFLGLPSYPRFVELIKHALFPLSIFTRLNTGKQSGIYYVDSSCLPVCHLKREKQHKTFDQIANKGKTSVGWFFGLKVHLVINDRGEMMAFKITCGNVHDVKPVQSLLSALKGLAFGDKGYISKKLFQELMGQGLKLITRKRKNMKSAEALTAFEKQLLNQRGLVETVFNHLKYHFQIWHTRHRSIVNAMTHLVAGLAAYVIEPLKLSAIKLLMQTGCSQHKQITVPQTL